MEAGEFARDNDGKTIVMEKIETQKQLGKWEII